MNFDEVADNVIDSLGSTVTLKIKTSSNSKYGDESYSSTSVSIIVGVNDINGEENWNREGVFIPGDKLFFIKSSVSDITEGNLITYRSNNYEIAQVISPDISGNLQFYEVRAHKV